VYYWVAQLVPKKHKAWLSWFVGWVYLFGSFCGTALNEYLLAQLLATCILLGTGGAQANGYTLTAAQVTRVLPTLYLSEASICWHRVGRVSGLKKELWVLSGALGIDCCGPVPFFADLWGDSSALYSPLLHLDRQYEMVRSSKYDRGVVPDPLHSGDLHHHVSHKSQVPERQVCVHAFRQGAGQWDQQRVACSALRAPVCPVHSHRLRGRFPCGRGGENCGHGWPPCYDPQCVCHCQHRVCAASGPHFLHSKP